MAIIRKWFSWAAPASFALAVGLWAQVPVPEPPMIWHGRLVGGGESAVPTVEWEITGAGVGVRLEAEVAVVNGEVFHWARIPVETVEVDGRQGEPSAGRLPLAVAPLVLNRSAAADGTGVFLVEPASARFELSRMDRGGVERLDLRVGGDGSGDLDSDGDGVVDWREALAGTDPLDAESVLRLDGVVGDVPGEGIRLLWRGVAGRVYSVRRATRPDGPWEVLASGLEAVGGPMGWDDPSPPADGARFYRVHVTP